jgi:hypothetical protein
VLDERGHALRPVNKSIFPYVQDWHATAFVLTKCLIPEPSCTCRNKHFVQLLGCGWCIIVVCNAL